MARSGPGYNGLLGFDARPRAWLWFLIGGSAATVAVGALPADLQPIGCTVVELATLLTLVVGLWLRRPQPLLSWVLVTVAVAGVTVARNQLPPEVLYPVVYLLLTVALAVLPVRRRYAAALADLTEAGMLICTAVVVSWSGLLEPLHERLAGSAFDDVAPQVVIAASLLPLLGLLIVVTTARRMVDPTDRIATTVLTGLAAVALTIGDTLALGGRLDAGGEFETGPAAIGWIAATLLLTAAVLHPSAAVSVEATTRAYGPAEAVQNPVVARGYIIMILVGPSATAISAFRELHGDGRLDLPDVGVPVAATTVMAVLLVTRLSQLATVAERRAAELQVALDEQTALREELGRQARHDPLTGLPNRTLLAERMEETALPGALLLLDLDGFKDVNDRYGHEVGDTLLVAIGERVGALLPSSHTLARLGGDEFAILLERTDEKHSVVIAEEILGALRLPFDVEPYQVHTAASVGLRQLEPNLTTVRALSDADLALYAAKAAGRDRLVCFEAPLRIRHLAQARMIDRLRVAIAHEQLSVHYQPVVDLVSDRWVTVEALARWMTGDRVLVTPDRFVPVAEESGLIVPLGTWVLRQACRDAAGWHRSHGTRLAVNVSVHQLREADFATVVLDALAESGLPPEALTLEITESALVGAGTSSTRAIAHLTTVRAAGVRVAIDDFGTGYSSLAYLRTMPIDAVKIDRAFVPEDDGADATLVPMIRAIVALARSLTLTTVVEGVETATQASVMQELGCDLGQGYHYGRPMTADALADGLGRVDQPA